MSFKKYINVLHEQAMGLQSTLHAFQIYCIKYNAHKISITLLVGKVIKEFSGTQINLPRRPSNPQVVEQ